METFILDYAKVSPVTILYTIETHFEGRIVARWIDCNSDIFGIFIVVPQSDIREGDVEWITNYLTPFFADSEEINF